MKTLILLISLFTLISCKPSSKTVITRPDLTEFSKHRSFLDNADKIIFYSTKPFPPKKDDPTTKLFHGYEILGSIELAKAELIKQIAQNIENNIYKGPGSSYAMCFNPRHGLRIHSGGIIKDFHFCFECSHLYIYEDIKKEDYIRIGLAESPDDKLFNHILNDANIPRDTVTE